MSAFVILLRKEHSQGKKKSVNDQYRCFFLDLKYFLLVEPIHVKPEGMEDQLERKNKVHTIELGTIPCFRDLWTNLACIS